MYYVYVHYVLHVYVYMSKVLLLLIAMVLFVLGKQLTHTVTALAAMLYVILCVTLALL